MSCFFLHLLKNRAFGSLKYGGFIKRGYNTNHRGRNSEDILAIELADIADTFLDRWVCFQVYPRPAILTTMKNRR